MADITPEKAITILHALKNEYLHPEVKEACDLAIECIQACKKKHRKDKKK